MSEAKEAALREALNSPMTGDERLRLSLILAEGGGEWEPDPDDAEATLDALDASRAREKALVGALREAREWMRVFLMDDHEAARLVDAALAPYSTPSPEAPSDVHPQECGQ